MRVEEVSRAMLNKALVAFIDVCRSNAPCGSEIEIQLIIIVEDLCVHEEHCNSLPIKFNREWSRPEKNSLG